MKTISREMIREQLARELGKGLDWCKGGYGRYFLIRINLRNGDVWADLFLNVEDYKIYSDDDILTITGFLERRDDMLSSYVAEALCYLRDWGFSIVD